MSWDDRVEVAVIGSGFAGLSAAIEAANAGVDVRVVEKAGSLGGNSKMSGGGMAAAHSDRQRELGIEDSVDQFVEDVLAAGGRINHEPLVRFLAENSVATVEWMRETVGVEFENALLHPGGHAVPRSFRPVGKIGGVGPIQSLLETAREASVDIETNRKFTEILTDGDEVTGYAVLDGYDPIRDDEGERETVAVERALVLATGGFAGDDQMRTAQQPLLDDSVRTTNHPWATGEVLREAIETGANPLHLSYVQLLPTTAADERAGGTGLGNSFVIRQSSNAVWIDPATGRRFVNELGDRRTRAMAELEVGTDPEHPLFVVDSTAASQFEHLDTLLEMDVVYEFDSLAALAGHFGVPTDALRDEVATYNEYVAVGEDADFGKPITDDSVTLEDPPWYALRLWPRVHHTMGGVQITTDAEVVGMDGEVIPSLYAAGEITGGIHGKSRLTSCAVPDCICFGRVAGARVAGAPNPYR